MSEKKWTAGPWIVEVGRDDYPNIISEDCGEIVGDEGLFSEYERDYHNANLIAAAPELYEALVALMPRNTGIGESMDWHAYSEAINKAKAAMAKARGEQ